jgi:hypothetical protein
MTKTKTEIKIVNCETGEEIIRDATPDEISEFAQEIEQNKTKNAILEAKAIAKTELLDRLGITEDEAKLLLS